MAGSSPWRGRTTSSPPSCPVSARGGGSGRIPAPAGSRPPPLPSLRLQASATEAHAVVAAAARTRRTLLLVFGGGALALLAAGLAWWGALRRRERLEAHKHAFTCAVTHELKTPIANISLYAETLRDHGADDVDNVPRFAGVILEEAERLRQRVQEVLDVATGRQGVPARRELFDPAAVVDQVCAEYRSRGAEIGQQVEPAPARGIAALFRRALEGVLDNAVKFAPGAPIRVALRRVRDRVVLEVEDGGPGIPAAERARVFEPFVRLGDALAREAPGTGLGLALVRQCVEACGGTVTLGAAAGGGVRVVIELEGGDAA